MNHDRSGTDTAYVRSEAEAVETTGKGGSAFHERKRSDD
jgi:hypothetical protein